MVNFFHVDDPSQHCCEVQFVLQNLLRLRDKKGGLGGHEDFAKFRSSREVRLSQNVRLQQRLTPGILA